MEIPEVRQCRIEGSNEYGIAAITAIDSILNTVRNGVWGKLDPKIGGGWIRTPDIEGWVTLTETDSELTEFTVWQCRDEDKQQFGWIAMVARDEITGELVPEKLAIFNPVHGLHWAKNELDETWIPLAPAQGGEE